MPIASIGKSLGRKFELFYSGGGHIGPYPSLFTAIRDAVRRVKGLPADNSIVIRERGRVWDASMFGNNVAVVDRSLGYVSVNLLDQPSGKTVVRSFVA